MTPDRRPTDEEAAAPSRSAHAQTLSRGILVLELLADTPQPLSIAEVARALELHRSVVYRILRTLEDHGLVRRDAAGRVRLGPGLAALARNVSRDLQQVAQPELSRIAERFGLTAFIGIFDRNDVVTMMSVEPRDVHASIAQRPGTRHAVNRGATGYAVLAALTPSEIDAVRASGLDIDDTRLDTVKSLGYATSHNEVIEGLRSVAVPMELANDPMAMALSVVSISEIDDTQSVADALVATATRIARLAS